MWKLGLWPSNSFSGNICFEYFGIVSLQCTVCFGRGGKGVLNMSGSMFKCSGIDYSICGDPWLGDKVDYVIGLSYRPKAHEPMQAGGPVRQRFAGVDFIPPVRVYEFGYRCWISVERPEPSPPSWPTPLNLLELSLRLPCPVLPLPLPTLLEVQCWATLVQRRPIRVR